MAVKSDGPVPSRDVTRRMLLARASLAATGLAGAGLLRADSADAFAWPAAARYDAEVATAWFDLALDLVRTTPGFSPPVASRALGYAGVTLYEAIAPGTPRRCSLAGRLNGFPSPPCGPADVDCHWPTVANSAMASILRSLFATTPPASAQAITDLEQRYATRGETMLPRGVYERSLARGAEVAESVFEWSVADGGHEGYLKNFPPFTPPAGPGLWVPTPPGFLSALQPFWGENRPFVAPADASCSPGPPPAYAEAPGSPFADEVFEVYRTANGLSDEQRAIALYWSDDAGLTATPPGHSLSILTQVIRRLDLKLGHAAEAYAKVGIAVADAFISCWRTKFDHNLLRPVTAIRRLIDPAYGSLLVTPPFAEYTSGHSVQSAAAARVMTDLFGRVAFTDHTHDRRGLPARSFESFRAAAREAAISRLYGGIHFRSAIERGLQQGDCIGRRASGLF